MNSFVGRHAPNMYNANHAATDTFNFRRVL